MKKSTSISVLVIVNAWFAVGTVCAQNSGDDDKGVFFGAGVQAGSFADALTKGSVAIIRPQPVEKKIQPDIRPVVGDGEGGTVDKEVSLTPLDNNDKRDVKKFKSGDGRVYNKYGEELDNDVTPGLSPPTQFMYIKHPGTGAAYDVYKYPDNLDHAGNEKVLDFKDFDASFKGEPNTYYDPDQRKSIIDRLVDNVKKVFGRSKSKANKTSDVEKADITDS